MKTIRWGIVGAGNIANRFAEACNNTRRRVCAVASRDIAKAEQFIKKYNIPHALAAMGNGCLTALT